LGPRGFFKKGSRGGHGQTVATTTAVVDPTVWPWQLAFELLARLCGQRTSRAVRGDPVFSYAHEEVPVFVPLHDLYLSYPSG